MENISASEGEVEERIRMMAESRGQTAEALRESLEKDDMLEHIGNEILNQKVFDFIESKGENTDSAKRQVCRPGGKP